MSVEFDELVEELGATAEGERAARPAPDAERPPLRSLSTKALRKIKRRRSMAVRAYIGPFGSGKTACMIQDSLPTILGERWECDNPDHLHTQAGEFSGWRKVLSTTVILDPRTGEVSAFFELLTSWTQILNAEHCDLLLDEITGIAGAREAMGLPVAVQSILQQLRRRDVHLCWTAPNWARADSIIRGGTQLVTDCRGWMADRALLKSETPPAWLPKRLFKVRSFVATDFDEWTAAKASQNPAVQVHALKPMVVQWWWGPRSMVFSAYRTLGAVSRIGEVLDGGRCAHCGGRRRVPECHCDH